MATPKYSRHLGHLRARNLAITPESYRSVPHASIHSMPGAVTLDHIRSIKFPRALGPHKSSLIAANLNMTSIARAQERVSGPIQKVERSSEKFSTAIVGRICGSRQF
jgi:hypothetical protein